MSIHIWDTSNAKTRPPHTSQTAWSSSAISSVPALRHALYPRVRALEKEQRSYHSQHRCSESTEEHHWLQFHHLNVRLVGRDRDHIVIIAPTRHAPATMRHVLGVPCLSALLIRRRRRRFVKFSWLICSSRSSSSSSSSSSSKIF